MIKPPGKYTVMTACLWLVLSCLRGTAQETPGYKNPALPVDARVHDLLGRMTPEEKFFQLFMIPGDLDIGREKLKTGIFGFSLPAKGDVADAAGQLVQTEGAVPARQMAERVNEVQKFFMEESRLQIPVIQFDEALHGLTREGATAFPQSIALAATFNTSLMRDIAKAIAAESRSRGIRQVLSPVLNIARDVRWGRTEETYGEDPFLVSQMGSAFIGEFEKAGIIATPKHFAVNVGDGGRDSYPIHLSELIMEELYFPAFKTAVQQAGARSVMTAYNAFNGSPCSANNWLLNTKLKQEWGFRGFVISDACAVGGANVLHYTASGYEDAGKQAVESGLDVIFQTDYSHARLFSPPFLNGAVRQGAVDSAVSRVLRAKFELGLFENPYVDPARADSINGAPAHRDLALQAARESMVLLKNDGDVLPVNAGVRSIAVIGTEAVEARLGGYSGKGNNVVSILEGIRQTAPANVTVSYSPGCGRQDIRLVTVPADNLSAGSEKDGLPGLRGEYFSNIRLEGKPSIVRTDKTIDFGWTLYGPDPSLPSDWYSVRWSGTITRNTGGNCKIGIEGNDGYRLYIDDRLLIDNRTKKSFGTKLADVKLDSGQASKIRIEYVESTGNARLRLVWNEGVKDTLQQSIEKAADVASKADLAIVVAGIEEGEFRDRSSLRLPGRQEELIRAVAATGTPVVVVLVGGSAITMDWIGQAGAILDAWYPGEAGGLAVAEVLFGKYNPAGRLPVTFPLSEGQLPLVYNHKPTGRGDDYNDLSGMPLFPFGFGQSYTTFEYSDLQFSRDSMQPADSATVYFTLTNTGKTAGDEVCQLYVRDELSSVSRPVTELKGFSRVHLAPGESRRISFSITPEILSMTNLQMKQVVEPGSFRIMIGSSSKDIRLRGILQIIR